tara:strand:+ start:77905 stop:78765 length:861 start_codon:yes stop_codon:yes gene_type:complete
MSQESFPRRVAIVGAGLLGGSVALSLRRTFPEIEIVAFARSEAKQEAAMASEIFDAAFLSIQETTQDCDAVVVGAPVNHIANLVCDIAECTGPDCLITDVGSTKAGIVAEIETHHLASRKFVAAHPIAGSEKTGLQHANAGLFDNKLIIITPGNVTDPLMLVRAETFWQATGGETIHMTPQEHDTHLAAVSHVPHLMSCLVALRSDSESRELVGSGWRDITRVAAGDPAMWTAICSANRDAIGKELSAISDSLTHLSELVQRSDDEALFRWLTDAKSARDSASIET